MKGFKTCTIHWILLEPGQPRLYSDGIRAGRPKSGMSILGRGNRHFSYRQRQDRLWDII
jgi:hypothetical protein